MNNILVFILGIVSLVSAASSNETALSHLEDKSPGQNTLQLLVEDSKGVAESMASEKSLKPHQNTDFGRVFEKKVDGNCQYQAIILSNGLKVILVHVPKLDKASAALTVQVGSFSDPKDFPGLAHFLEHVLFLGTEKYPQENEYREFLAAHGGSSNAFTSNQHTSYLFEVLNEHFEQALDRFAQFFVAPLFNPDGMSREMQAVDSEFTKNLNDDVRRIDHVKRILSHSDHPYSRFTSGCKESLDKPGVRDAVIEFYKQHYSSNIMTAVLVGAGSLEELAQLAREKFSIIPNKSLPIPTVPNRPWTHVEKLVCIKSIKAMQTLIVSWQIDDIPKYQQGLINDYFSYLFNDAGEGSLLHTLAKKDLITGLSAAFDSMFHGFSSFRISFELTPKGLEAVEEIIETCYQYIALLKECGPQQWICRETTILNQMRLKSASKEKFTKEQAYYLTFQAHVYIPAETDSASSWNPKLVETIVDDFNVDNCRVILAHPNFDIDHTWSEEHWYGTHYKVQDLGESMLKRCSQFDKNDNSQLQLPQPTGIVDRNLEFIGKLAQDDPKRQPDQLKPCLWFKQDDQFGLPNSSYYVLLKTPMVFESPLAAISADLYVSCVFSVLVSSVFRDPNLTGFSINPQVKADGFEIKVCGFSDKAPELLETIVEHFVSLELSSDTFAIIKDQIVRNLKNYGEKEPVWHANDYSDNILQEKMIHWKDKLMALENVTQDSVFKFGQEAVKSCNLVVLVNGNNTEDDAVRIEKRLVDIVQPLNTFPNHNALKDVKLPIGDFVFHDVMPAANITSSAINFYLQTGTLDQAKSRQLVQLFVQIFHDQFFDQLRTKEQLGYIVQLLNSKRSVTTGFKMVIQSERDPCYLENRIESFLDSTVDKLMSMPEEQFSKYRQSLVSLLTGNNTQLSEESDKFWEQIVTFNNDFQQRFVDAKGVSELSKEDLIQFAKQFIVKGAPERRKLAVHIWPESKTGLMNESYGGHNVIKNISGFVNEHCELLDVSYKAPQ